MISALSFIPANRLQSMQAIAASKQFFSLHSYRSLFYMILFENNIIKLDYNPATDILEARYPDLHDNLLPEIKHSIDILVDTVKNYDVKNLMLDSTRTVFAVSAEESREIAVYMATGLSRTRLQRLARVRAINPEVETRAKGTMQHFKETGVLTFDLKSFPSTTDALQWLKEHNS